MAFWIFILASWAFILAFCLDFGLLGLQGGYPFALCGLSFSFILAFWAFIFASGFPFSPFAAHFGLLNLRMRYLFRLCLTALPTSRRWRLTTRLGRSAPSKSLALGEDRGWRLWRVVECGPRGPQHLIVLLLMAVAMLHVDVRAVRSRKGDPELVGVDLQLVTPHLEPHPPGCSIPQCVRGAEHMQ